jgi:hypothetical protein
MATKMQTAQAGARDVLQQQRRFAGSNVLLKSGLRCPAAQCCENEGSGVACSEEEEDMLKC